MKRDATILMTLMGLEIGGAETHVVELSKALQKKATALSLHPMAVFMRKNCWHRGLSITGCQCTREMYGI